MSITESLLASLPSPGSSSISIGPLELRAYGLMIAIGVIVLRDLPCWKALQRDWTVCPLWHL